MLKIVVLLTQSDYSLWINLTTDYMLVLPCVRVCARALCSDSHTQCQWMCSM